MPKFTEAFGIAKSQAELDFVNVELLRDKPLYLDPYALQLKDDEWSSSCTAQIRSFFNEILSCLRDNKLARAAHLMANLHEPNETRFGVSAGEPRGRAIGVEKAKRIVIAMRDSRAFETGVLSDLSDAALFVFGIGPDTISDLATNVCRELLCIYTKNQCDLLGVQTSTVRTLGPVWNASRRNWAAMAHQLPVYMGRPIVLVPKFSVRHTLALNSQEFYNHHMIEFQRAEYLHAGGALVETLKDGTPYVTKKSVKEIHPFIKDDLVEFVRQHPAVLEAYKNLKGAQGPLSDQEFARVIENGHFDERLFANALINRIAEIPPGGQTASEYHSFAMGVCTFLLYPNLSNPIKEAEIHQGRKRIDIRYSNTASDGFFYRMVAHNGARAITIPIECKNYTNEIKNPEFDQLSGRFSPHRGRFGFLLCRAMEDRATAIARCRDTVSDDRGYIVVLEDRDLIEMLAMVSNGERSQIDYYLQQRFNELV